MKRINKQKDKVYYDKKSDVLWLLVKSGVEYEHKEVSPGIAVELGKKGELFGVEILNASKILGSKIKSRAASQFPAASI